MQRNSLFDRAKMCFFQRLLIFSNTIEKAYALKSNLKVKCEGFRGIYLQNMAGGEYNIHKNVFISVQLFENTNNRVFITFGCVEFCSFTITKTPEFLISHPTGE